MDTNVTISKKFNYAAIGMMALGVLALGYGLFTDSPRGWANILLNNYYFLSLTVGATFFFCLQYITQSGWSAMFRRVPEAIMSYLPVAGIIMLLLFFGVKDLYHWSHADAVAHDPLIAHKAPYLNVPFFFIRIFVVFAAWFFLSRQIRKLSLEEDKIGGVQYLEKIEFWAKIFIFVLALTYSMGAFDWIMSLEVHWFSTIFAFKSFASAFYHGTALVALVVILLHERGYFKQLNESHLLDFSRYLFGLSIIWGYLYFAQFMLIWFSNLPEETIYYSKRWNNGWMIFFIVNLVVNWLIPFVLLLPQKLDKNIKVVKYISILLLIGMWTEQFELIMPEITVTPHFGVTEIGALVCFTGLFLFIVGRSLAKAALIPKNHPYLEESELHHVH
ncbi:MAG: quinol:cytochrome C oxidoreductase [Bacteroidales bacterium]|nr:quinol:cytochrome C oxidoreductase [Bacteroidales bacterium]